MAPLVSTRRNFMPLKLKMLLKLMMDNRQKEEKGNCEAGPVPEGARGQERTEDIDQVSSRTHQAPPVEHIREEAPSLLNAAAGPWTIWQRLGYISIALIIVLGYFGIQKFLHDLTGNLLKRTAPPMKGTLGQYKYQ